MSDAKRLHKDFKHYTQEDWVHFVQLIEQHGGSKELAKRLGSDPKASQAPKGYVKADAKNTNPASVTVKVHGPIVYVDTDKPLGSGSGSGAADSGEYSGSLNYVSEEDLKSATSFIFHLVEGYPTLVLLNDTLPVAGFFRADKKTGNQLDVKGTFKFQ